MQSILSYFQSLNIDFILLGKTTGLILGGLIFCGLVGRFIFGRDSALTAATSSAVGILFIYAVTLLLQNTASSLQTFISPLPYLSIESNTITFFSFQNTEYTLICAQVLSMIILSFLVNLIDRWIPQGKRFFGWIFFRCVTIFLAMALHVVAHSLLQAWLPATLQTYAPTALLILLLLSLATGCLKFIVSIFIATVNPLIGALYGFFFASFVGKQITKAVLTTAILSGIVCLLSYFGINTISLSTNALVIAVPLILLLSGVWYIVGSFMKK